MDTNTMIIWCVAIIIGGLPAGLIVLAVLGSRLSISDIHRNMDRNPNRQHQERQEMTIEQLATIIGKIAHCEVKPTCYDIYEVLAENAQETIAMYNGIPVVSSDNLNWHPLYMDDDGGKIHYNIKIKLSDPDTQTVSLEEFYGEEVNDGI